VVFQPIFEVQGDGLKVHGVEALMRGPMGTRLEQADILFDYVRRKGEEARVDRACVTAALEGAVSFPKELRLNVNVHASTLGADSGFVSFLADTAERASIDPGRLTVEIVEHEPFWDGAGFHGSLRGLRDVGIAIALDDVGCGQSNYRMVVECRPDQFKIDRFFVHGAGRDRCRAIVLESILSLAENLGGQAVAEGVEDATDLETVMKVGIRYVQGHFLAPAVAVTGAARAGLVAQWRDRGRSVARDPKSTKPPARSRVTRRIEGSLAPGLLPGIDTNTGEGEPAPEWGHLRKVRKMEKRKKILLVDDSKTALLMASMILKKGRYDVVTAEDGEDALRRTAAEHPDLILMDVVMPKMTGFEACRELRKQAATRAIPIIMLTTRGERANLETGFESGCTDYVTKPIDSLVLLAKVKDCLGD
jgi:EAL domain-containing protein (putative c-di-GMP-specific phosphodiesterase class I)